MDLTGPNLKALYDSYLFLFDEAYQSYDPWISKVADTIPSGTESNVYPFIADIPQVREWIGPRLIQNVATRDYRLTNKDYELTLVLPRNKIKDDQYNVYGPAVKNMGQQFAFWPDTQMALNIQANPVGFDGEAFFSQTHPNTSGLAGADQSNLYALALNATNLATVMSGMASLKRDNGLPLKVKPTTLMVPPQLQLTAMTLMNSAFIALPTIQNLTSLAGSTTNPFAGLFEVLVVPELANEATTWYLLDTSKAVKPFIFQQRETPSFVAMTDPSSPNVFWQKEFVYGADARGAFGVSLWFLAAKSVG